MQRFWLRDGNWYKGNLHTHTTQSDGAVSPEEMMACYRKAGYDFLALSDHNRLTRVAAAPDGLRCWCVTGTEGDGSCPRLADLVHCRNCPEFGAFGRRLKEGRRAGVHDMGRSGERSVRVQFDAQSDDDRLVAEAARRRTPAPGDL